MLRRAVARAASLAREAVAEPLGKAAEPLALRSPYLWPTPWRSHYSTAPRVRVLRRVRAPARRPVAKRDPPGQVAGDASAGEVVERASYDVIEVALFLAYR